MPTNKTWLKKIKIYYKNITKTTENTNKYNYIQIYWQTDPTFWFFKANETSPHIRFVILTKLLLYKLL